MSCIDGRSEDQMAYTPARPRNFRPAEPCANNTCWYLLATKYLRGHFVRRWGRGWRLTKDRAAAHRFEDGQSFTGRSAGCRARCQRERIEARVNVPLQVVWVFGSEAEARKMQRRFIYKGAP